MKKRVDKTSMCGCYDFALDWQDVAEATRRVRRGLPTRRQKKPRWQEEEGETESSARKRCRGKYSKG